MTGQPAVRRPAVPPPEFNGSYFGPDLVVRGHIKGQGALCVDGVVDGDISTNAVELGSTARVRASIEVENAVISGNMAGIIKARHVAFTDGCRFEGDVQYETLGIESDAMVEAVMHPVVNGDARTHAGQKVVRKHLERPVARPLSAAIHGHSGVEPSSQAGEPSVRSWLKALAVLVIVAAVAVVGVRYVAPLLEDVRSALSTLVEQKRSPGTVEPADLTPVTAPLNLATDPPLEPQVAPAPVKPDPPVSAPAAPSPAKPAAPPDAPAVPVPPQASGAGTDGKLMPVAETPAPASGGPAAGKEAPAAVTEPPKAPEPTPEITAPEAVSPVEPKAEAPAASSGPPVPTVGSEATDPPPAADTTPAKPAPREQPAATSSDGCSWVLQCDSDDKCVSVRQCNGQ